MFSRIKVIQFSEVTWLDAESIDNIVQWRQLYPFYLLIVRALSNYA